MPRNPLLNCTIQTRFNHRCDWLTKPIQPPFLRIALAKDTDLCNISVSLQFDKFILLTCSFHKNVCLYTFYSTSREEIK